MPFALAVIGILLIVTGARGTYSDLKTLLVSDFSGQGNFFYWIMAIGVVGSIGYVPALEKFSRVFIALIIVALVLSHRGFFAQFMAAFKGGASATAGAGNVTGSGSSGAGGSEAGTGNGGEPLSITVSPSGSTATLNKLIGTPSDVLGGILSGAF